MNPPATDATRDGYSIGDIACAATQEGLASFFGVRTQDAPDRDEMLARRDEEADDERRDRE